MRACAELFVWDAHVNHDSDSHASDNKGERELFFLFWYNSHCVMIAPELISHV